MKLSRAALAALAALLLACPGRANLSVVPTAPYDFKAAPLSAEASSALAFLGYRFDEASGTIRRPDGGLLTRRQMQHLLSACRVLPGSLSLDDRWSLLSGGYRIDEAKDAVLSPATHAPMTCLELAEFKLYSSRDLQQLVLERLDALLSNQDPDRPLPMEDFAKARSIARQAPLALPPSLVRAFSGPLGVRPPPTPAGIWASAVDRAYVASTRFWDGAQKHLQGLTYVSPVLPELSSAPAPRPYFDAAERDAGQDLQRAAAAYFERWPLGRELLGHFRDPNGSLRLPPFTILDLGPADLVAAVYNAHSKSIMINRSYLEKASRGLPAGSQDRNTAILKSMDVTLFHELTHAWQDRRDGLMADLDRGSAPMDIYLEYEVEAKLAG
ncbi:MAG: hypothetical protein KGK30_03025, partial [Elusimicrobia bacterium]|nr:hypothetical protein [Elusimicrobiota bacterium]